MCVTPLIRPTELYLFRLRLVHCLDHLNPVSAHQPLTGVVIILREILTRPPGRSLLGPRGRLNILSLGSRVVAGELLSDL